MSGWNFAHWRKPFLNVDSQPDRLTLELPITSIIPDETLQKLRDYFGEAIDLLGKEELIILSSCQIEGETSNYRLQFLIDQHKTEITRILQELCKQGFLESDNKGRWTTYHLNTEYNLSSNVDTSTKLNVDATSTPNVDTSNTPNVDTSNTLNVDTSDAPNVDTLKNEQSLKRFTKEELYQLILRYYENEYRSAEEIAKNIQKDVKYLKNRIIPSIIEEKLLERLFPSIKNHPKQKYKKQDYLK